MKACPFCGSEKLEIKESELGLWYILCSECRAEGPGEGNQEDAVKVWGRRLPIVTGCPNCGGHGSRVRGPGDEGYRGASTYVSPLDFMECEVCRGSGKVFVVPAVVWKAAPK